MFYLIRYLPKTMCVFSIFALLILTSSTLQAQEYEVPKHEFRATWIATVINLDWPQSGGLPPRFQKDDLLIKLDRLQEAGINVVYFQIRTEGDALYDSPTEPWSKYLTGEEGRAPDPYWDPLTFAIEEAHKRGMELHAWLNPYRAMRSIPSDFSQKTILNQEIDPSLEVVLKREFDQEGKMKLSGTSQRAANHVSNTHPEWLLVMNGSIAIFDPGLQEAIEYNRDIVLDVVNRYDVDGIHFDDYFYPYPPNHMGSSSANEKLDDDTFAKYPRGYTNKDDWRRANVDLLVEMIHDSIQVVKPWVKFGISPFGIWKSGVPSGISGMNAFDTIYGDGIAWLEQRTVDYITPQLYWGIERWYSVGQDYRALADWWADKAHENERHMYPGHGLYRTSSSTFTGTLFNQNEMPRQIKHNRSNPLIQGSVFFRAKNITSYSSKGFADTLKTNYYRYAALPPIMSWKDSVAHATPQNLQVQRDAEKEYEFHLSWDPVEVNVEAKRSATGYVDSLVKYAIYRVDAPDQPDPNSAMNEYYHLVGVAGTTEFTDVAPPSEHKYWYFITSATRNSIESSPSSVIEAGVVVSTEDALTRMASFDLLPNYPNPFNPSTVIPFTLEKGGLVQLEVFDLLGRKVATLVNEELQMGSHSFSFEGASLSSGVYVYRLQQNEQVLTRSMTLIK